MPRTWRVDAANAREIVGLKVLRTAAASMVLKRTCMVFRTKEGNGQFGYVVQNLSAYDPDDASLAG
jgi:hypothetical protein